MKKEYSVEDLIEKAKEMSACIMASSAVANSGHSHTGRTLLIIEIKIILYNSYIVKKTKELYKNKY